jgi:hypothetical protein
MPSGIGGWRRHENSGKFVDSRRREERRDPVSGRFRVVDEVDYFGCLREVVSPLLHYLHRAHGQMPCVATGSWALILLLAVIAQGINSLDRNGGC